MSAQVPCGPHPGGSFPQTLLPVECARAETVLWLHPSEKGPLWPADLPLPSPPGFKETAFLYAISSAGLTHALAKACSAGRMERCTCDEAPDLENREAWQWGGCGDNLKYSSKFVKEFLGRRSSKDLRARVDFHSNLVGVKASRAGRGAGKSAGSRARGGQGMVWVQLACAGAQRGKVQVVGRVPMCLRGGGQGLRGGAPVWERAGGPRGGEGGCHGVSVPATGDSWGLQLFCLYGSLLTQWAGY